jgi:hypothetical protein
MGEMGRIVYSIPVMSNEVFLFTSSNGPRPSMPLIDGPSLCFVLRGGINYPKSLVKEVLYLVAGGVQWKAENKGPARAKSKDNTNHARARTEYGETKLKP